MMIGQFFILSPRGDTIINKDFRGDAIPGLQELFFRKVKSMLNSISLLGIINNINIVYIHINC